MLQTVDRALRLLQFFDEADREYRVGEMAAMLGIDKSIASRLVTTLAERGFLERVSRDGGFRLGPEIGRLGLLAVSNRRNLAAVAQAPMERLAAETDETVYLATLEGNEVLNVAQVEGPHVVGVGDWVGWRMEPHCTAIGKVLLAFTTERDGNLPLEDPLEAFTERTITSLRELHSELERARSRGWAASVGEFEEGLHGVAAPVFDASEQCRAALSVAGPSYRLPRSRLPELAERCRRAAREIEARLRL